MKSAASITIDVDGIDCYRAIHGLPTPDSDRPDPIFTRALPRFLQKMRGLGQKATLFIVGEDLARPEARELVGEAAEAGHEIGSHSFAHDYRLSRRPRTQIDADLTRAADVIEGVTGARPRGFRAPGYNLSEDLLDAVEATGHRYDSSLFPTPAYFGLRALAIARLRFAGRTSSSLVGDVREFCGPRDPYRPSKNARHRPVHEGEESRNLVEVPMSVATPLRMPWLGTTLSLLPTPVGAGLTRAALAHPGPCVLELHAIDLLGPDDGVERPLIDAQVDLQVPLHKKLDRLERSIEHMAAQRTISTLETIAAHARGV